MLENTMLIVDDTDLNLEVLSVLFEEEYQIIEASSGEEAMSFLEACNGKVDVVLLDLIMPGMSGFDVLEKRRKIDNLQNVPFVVITSSGNMDDQIKSFELGASDFINKPFVPEIVVTRVNNVMNSHRRMLTIELEAQKLRIKSELDAMTGLYNKTTTELIAGEHLRKENGQLNVLIILDIDNFKTVNDSSGHLAGDHVLKIISDLIAAKFRKTDVVGRIGGDEFVVLMVGIPSMEIAYNKVNELVQLMRYKPNLTIPEYVTLSIGVASNNGNAMEYEALFAHADAALYQAKADGKACYRVYGVEPINQDGDNCPTVLLLSNNRSVCSVVHSLIPQNINVIEVLRLDDLARVNQNQRDHLIMSYLDISDFYGDDAVTALDLLTSQHDWVDIKTAFAICSEGALDQYQAALDAGVLDLMLTPLDMDSFKRRTHHQLENLGLIEPRPTLI